MTETASPETTDYQFQAEIQQLLQLLAHSLYQNKDVALRELVSNASDALDKRRIAELGGAGDAGEDLAIRIEPDRDANTLTIRDNGVGMGQEELVENLGTIAKSGSKEFLAKLKEGGDDKASLIGQFGVGFYSAFMLADTVEVRTRRHDSDEGFVWESEGTGSFTIAPATDLPVGTSVVLHLKDDAREFAQDYRLKGIVGKYSSFVTHPIFIGDEKVNDVKPIWVEPKASLTGEQYDAFYKHLSHGMEETPAWHLHFAVDSPIQFHALLYAPRKNFELLGMGRLEHGVNLCAKRILVQGDCREILPEWLRFLRGVVDSQDLPLNVSREALQDDTVFRKIRTVLVKKLIDRMEKLAKDNPEDYKEFYGQFGPMLKEGVHGDWEFKGRLAGLLRFASTNDPESRTSLPDYVSRMSEGQDRIYHLGGPNLASLRENPNLEIFRKKGLEVLLLPDPLDEYVLTSLGRFEHKEFQSIEAADLDLPGVEETPEISAGFAGVLSLFQDALKDRAEEVRVSKRLTDAPCCLVSAGGMSGRLENLMRMAGREDGPDTKRILELNPKSKLIDRLATLAGNDQNAGFLRQAAHVLYDNALLLDGLSPDPAAAAGRTQKLLEELAGTRSSIIV